MSPEERAAFLELSDERDRWLKRVRNAELSGLKRGWTAGYEDGYLRAEQEMADLWSSTKWRRQETDQERDARVGRALAEAEAYTRRTAAEHEQAFVEKCHNTPMHERSPMQHVVCWAYGWRDEYTRQRQRQIQAARRAKRDSS